ncbi:sushi, von Willebrand factor type A, EGF and pentraxin domain-containing protein 1-like [Littorina saxatilis]|uniref:sushi, von Willebrand factor type A, EGF and pentraxin domain-containing protein 1-like n=1 Tax=Littorina saxatilis TaxID=31220 RepID=UPI0038B66632
MKGAAALLVLVCCVGGVSGCRPSRSFIFIRYSPPPPLPRHPPVFVRPCPASITVTAGPRLTTAQVSWAAPTARSQNDGRRHIRIEQTGGPPPNSIFHATYPTMITYRAVENHGVPPSHCSFYVNVKVLYCDPMPGIQHGTRTCSGSRTNMYGSVCTHACNNGYRLTGKQNVTCQSTQAWNHAPPSCPPVSCGTPPAVDNGRRLCHRGYTYPEVCVVECNPGYSYTASSPFVSCRADGTWSPVYSCVDVQPPTFPNGCPVNQELFSGPLETPVAVFWDDPDTLDNSNQSVTLTSDPAASGSLLGPGFHLITITANDSSANSASCNFVVEIRARVCPDLPAPPNSHVTCSRGYVEGSACMITCNHDYDIEGQALLTCLHSEQWNAPLPICEAGGCSTPPTVEKGVFTCPNGHTYLATCDLVCDKGFEVQNPPYIQCSYDETWTSLGSCEDTELPDFPEGCPDNLDIYAAHLGQPTLVTWSPPHVTDNSDQAIELSSNIEPGSNFSIGVTHVTYTAVDPTGNSRTCSFTVTVNTAVCPLPDLEPSNRLQKVMTYTCADGYVYGASCDLNCTYGYPLIGSDTIICQKDDATYPPTMFWDWAGPSAVKPECTVSECPDLQPPANGAFSCNHGNIGWDCLMSCQEPYDVPAVLNRDGHFYCSTSAWSPSKVPDCTVSVRPGAARLHSDLFYYTSSCNTSGDALKQNFITRMNAHSVLQNACLNVPSCTVEKIQVTCSENGRRRRSPWTERESGSDRYKRNAGQTHYVLIAFDIVIPYQHNASQTQADFKQVLESTKGAIYDSLVENSRNGTFDFEGMTIDGPSLPTLQADCPDGTTSSLSSTMSCVGCSKGLYMSGQPGQCLECAMGSYAELDNATSCTPCPQGMTTLTTGSQSLEECLELCTAGSVSPDGFVPCQPCPPGHYQSRDGVTTCDLCPVNTWTQDGGANSSLQCIPADVTLTNTSVSGHMTGAWSVLTVSLWVKLPDNSSLVISITDGNDNSTLLASYVAVVADVGTSVEMGQQTGNRNESSDSGAYATQALPTTAWSRLLFILVAPDTNMTQLPENVPLLTVGYPSPNITVIEVSTENKKVVVSGLKATTRTPTQEEITAASTSCMGNHSDENYLTWTPKPSVMSVPSVCDAVNECLSDPCGQHGACEDRLEDFQCFCQDGWTGPTCDVPPDPCYQHQCQSGATCVAGNATYTCDCPPGMTGKRCTDQIVDGGWGEWSSWSQCSATCGGQQQRQRPCNNPAPQHGGLNCTGDALLTQSCGQSLCIVNGSLSDWTTWSACSATCGGGETTRQRTCENPSGSNDNDEVICEGDTTETQVCNSSAVPCPEHGGWSDWTDWSPCSVTCGDGIESRARSCDSPVPTAGGDPCDGVSSENQTCHLQGCPECTTLPRPAGGVWNCTSSQSPYLQNCSITCLDGYVIAESPPPYTCGEETSYLWSHQQNQSSENPAELPSCTRPVTMTSATYSQSATLNAGCDDSTKTAVTDGIHQNLDSSVVCLQQEACQVSVTSACSTNAEGIHKRSAPSLVISMLFSLNLGNSVTLNNSGNDTSDWSAYQQLTSLAEQSLDQTDDLETLLTVTFGAQTITPDMNSVSDRVDVVCPRGTVFVDRYCVPCPAGSTADDEQCVLCPLGKYQDQPASHTCKPCPDDLTWDVTGATDVTQCRYPKNPNQFPVDSSTEKPSNTEDKMSETNLGLVVFVACMAIIAVLGFSLAAACYKWRQVQAAKRPRRGPRRSWVASHKVEPCTSRSYVDPPPAYTPTDLEVNNLEMKNLEVNNLEVNNLEVNNLEVNNLEERAEEKAEGT